MSTAQNPGNVRFDVPGSYIVSLTVIDSTGNSDPSPPTRTINVLPTTPDFSITVGPAAQQVVPGGLATYTVNIIPLNGFTGTVSFGVDSESGFPSGITSGGFSPASISTSGSSTLTMQTTASAVPYALSLTITGTSGTISHTASTTLLVNLAPPGGLTASAGNSQVSLSWPASVGASGYHAKRAKVDGGPYQTFACPSGTGIVDTGLVAGITYYYAVSAFYTGGPDVGGESANSMQASATPQGSTPTPPAAPTALTAKSNKPATIDLQWVQSTGAGVTTNAVYRRQLNGTYSSLPTYSINATTSFRDSKVSRGTSYCYVITGTNASGQSAPSNEACAKTK